MSEEELNKKIEFIVEHQAKFASELDQLREVQEADSKVVKNGLLSVVEIVGQLTRTQVRTEQSVNSLTNSVSSLTNNVTRLEEAQARTDERLNIFINVVERFISGNGGAESPA